MNALVKCLRLTFTLRYYRNQFKISVPSCKVNGSRRETAELFSELHICKMPVMNFAFRMA